MGATAAEATTTLATRLPSSPVVASPASTRGRSGEIVEEEEEERVDAETSSASAAPPANSADAAVAEEALVVHSGWLSKRAQRGMLLGGLWQRRFFTLVRAGPLEPYRLVYSGACSPPLRHAAGYLRKTLTPWVRQPWRGRLSVHAATLRNPHSPPMLSGKRAPPIGCSEPSGVEKNEAAHARSR
jgi:hypothetical protein